MRKLAIATAACLMLAGCGGSNDPAPKASPSPAASPFPSVSVAPSPNPDVSPTPEERVYPKTPEGRFARAADNVCVPAQVRRNDGWIALGGSMGPMAGMGGWVRNVFVPALQDEYDGLKALTAPAAFTDDFATYLDYMSKALDFAKSFAADLTDDQTMSLADVGPIQDKLALVAPSAKVMGFQVCNVA